MHAIQVLSIPANELAVKKKIDCQRKKKKEKKKWRKKKERETSRSMSGATGDSSRPITLSMM